MCGCVAVAVEGEQGVTAGGSVRMRLVGLVVFARERKRERVNERAASQTNVADDIDAAKPALASASNSKFPNIVC